MMKTNKLKSYWRRSLALLALCISLCPLLKAEVNPQPFVVPALTSWTGAEGHLALSGRIVVRQRSLSGVAQALAADYRQMFGRDLVVTKGRAQAGDVVLSLRSDAALGNEGYRFEVGRCVELSAATARGVFWATRTLLQISETSADRTLPCGAATDVPNYALRGFMLDCGRKFFPMDYLHKLTKVMAYYKMNTLQIHLNDNGFVKYFGNDWMRTQAAFRLQCDTYPGLTAKDGSYSKREFIDLQNLALANGVEIIPEIDVPAHSLAFTQYKPELGSSEYGMDHLDLFNPETYTFLDGLFKEYLAGPDPVFKGKRVHIGTDEYSNARREVVEKFRAFTDRYIRYVEGFGKQAVVWGALTHARGDTPVKSKDVLMHCWYNGYADPADMKRAGYRLVSIPDGLVYIVPAAGYYYDYLNCAYLYEHWTPAVIGDCHFEENDPSLEGGMFAVWNDHVGNGISVKDVHHRIFPALQTLAVKCWSGRNTRLSFADFQAACQALSEAPGVNELGRIGARGETPLHLPELRCGDTLSVEEVGYNYAVSFDIEPQAEQPGAELLRSANAVFYLADPKTGKLGFERDGYLNTFNYQLQPGKKVHLTLEGDNRGVRLWIDGQKVEELAPKTLYALHAKDLVHQTASDTPLYEPVVYAPTDKMGYISTLVFPLRRVGRFASRITRFEVKVL